MMSAAADGDSMDDFLVFSNTMTTPVASHFRSIARYTCSVPVHERSTYTEVLLCTHFHLF